MGRCSSPIVEDNARTGIQAEIEFHVRLIETPTLLDQSMDDEEKPGNIVHVSTLLETAQDGHVLHIDIGKAVGIQGDLGLSYLVLKPGTRFSRTSFLLDTSPYIHN